MAEAARAGFALAQILHCFSKVRIGAQLHKDLVAKQRYCIWNIGYHAGYQVPSSPLGKRVLVALSVILKPEAEESLQPQ